MLEKDRCLGWMLVSELCTDNRRLSGAKALHSATTLMEEDHDLGFKGTRIIASNAEAYLEISSPSELLQYEKELGASFNFPLSAFCLYSGPRLVKRRLDEFLLSLFPLHGVIVAKTLAWDKGKTSSA